MTVETRVVEHDFEPYLEAKRSTKGALSRGEKRKRDQEELRKMMRRPMIVHIDLFEDIIGKPIRNKKRR